MDHDARAISRLLASRIEALVRELLPAGKQDGSEWRVGSLAGEVGKSCAVHLVGRKAGVWSDFAAGMSGDALGLVAEVLYGGNLGEALAWSRRWLGLGEDPVKVPYRKSPSASPLSLAGDDTKRTAFAWQIFAAAQPTIIGTPADRYLLNRGIDLRDLGRQPRALRFHHALPCREAGKPLPAMVAAISGSAGSFQGIHRTWLARRDESWWKADLSSPKKVLGRVAGGSIRLWRGSSGKSLAMAPDGDSVIIAEGIETALTAALACPERRVLASVSIGNMALIDLPAAIKTVTIAGEADAPDSPATRALQAAIDRFSREGRHVLVARSPIGGDLNDLLTAETY